jgi:hypothetical protein
VGDRLLTSVRVAAVLAIGAFLEGRPGRFRARRGLLARRSSSATDVDWYNVSVLDFGIPFVVVDADPERDGTGTDIALRFDNLVPVGTIMTDSSGLGSPGDPPAEGFAINGLGYARVSGTGPGTYLLGAWYSGDGCPVPVELQTFEIR